MRNAAQVAIGGIVGWGLIIALIVWGVMSGRFEAQFDDMRAAGGRRCGCPNPRLVLTGGAPCDRVCPGWYYDPQRETYLPRGAVPEPQKGTSVRNEPVRHGGQVAY